MTIKKEVIYIVVVLQIITLFINYIYYNSLINYFTNLLQTRRGKQLIKLFPIIQSTLLIFLIPQKLPYFLGYIVLLLSNITILKLIFDEPLRTIYILSIHQIIPLIIFRDIIIAIISILICKPLYQTIQIFEIYLVSFTLSQLLNYLLLNKFNKKYSTNKIKTILIHSKKLSMSILIINSLLILLMINNYTYYHSKHSIIFLFGGVLIGFCFYFVMQTNIKYIQWMEEEVFYKTTLLNLEHNTNINKKIEEYSKLLKIYQHDFKSILLNIQDAITIGNIEEIKQIICEFNDKQQQLVNYTKKFSNNSLINALFNRLYEDCCIQNINFNGECYIPDKISISELELLNIFNNLVSNAFEACIKQQQEEEKWINFKSYVKEGYLIIYQTNSFNGHIKFKNNKLITTKENKKIHGIGVESIKYTVNKANGIALIKLDKNLKEFKFLIKIPLE